MFEDDETGKALRRNLRGDFDPIIEFARMTAARPKQIARLLLADLVISEENENTFDYCGFVFIGKADQQIAVSREAYLFLLTYVGMDRQDILSKNGIADKDAPDSIFLSSHGRRLSASSISDKLSEAFEIKAHGPDYALSGPAECGPCKWSPLKFIGEEALLMYQQAIERIVMDNAKEDRSRRID